LILEYKNKIALRQRKDKDIWQDLYEFPLIEKVTGVDTKNICGGRKEKMDIEKRVRCLICFSNI
jgi:adenine-specific DNA glycosylase